MLKYSHGLLLYAVKNNTKENGYGDKIVCDSNFIVYVYSLLINILSIFGGFFFSSIKIFEAYDISVIQTI